MNLKCLDLVVFSLLHQKGWPKCTLRFQEKEGSIYMYMYGFLFVSLFAFGNIQTIKPPWVLQTYL